MLNIVAYVYCLRTLDPRASISCSRILRAQEHFARLHAAGFVRSMVPSSIDANGSHLNATPACFKEHCRDRALQGLLNGSNLQPESYVETEREVCEHFSVLENGSVQKVVNVN